MGELDDIELLRRYVSDRAEDAFAALVSRHINLVYSAALRQTRNAAVAEDVTQAVFILLSKKARSVRFTGNLAGWLHRCAGYVASEAMRSENRRRAREISAVEMNPDVPKAPSLLDRIEPAFDEAMRKLSDGDRQVVMLRFLQNKSLKELGAALDISEDAAQKRVARAVEKLRAALARSGVAASAGALAATLGTLPVHSAPPSLVTSVATAVAAPAAATAASLLTQQTLNLMAWTKIKTGAVAVALATGVSAPIFVQQRALNETRHLNEGLTARVRELETRAQVQPSASAQTIAPAELDRLRREAAEVHKLRAQVAELTRNLAQPAAARPLSRSLAPTAAADAELEPAGNDPMQRQGRADLLAKQGKFAEALEEYLWCYDEGAKASPSYVGVRGSFLLNKIKDLAARYPAAHDALAARRDASQAALLNGTSSDPMKVLDLIRLNDALDEPNQSMALFDQLPERHPARAHLVDLAMDQFIQASRYQDIVSAGHPEAAFDRTLMAANAAKAAGIEDKMLASMQRRNVVEAAGRGIEALAGVGQVDRAIALANKALEYDPSPETRGELLKHAERAGNASLILALKSN